MERKEIKKSFRKSMAIVIAIAVICLTALVAALSLDDPAVYWNPGTVISDASGTIIVPAGSDAYDGLSPQQPVYSMNKVLSVASTESLDTAYMISTNFVSLGTTTLDGGGLNLKRYDYLDSIADFTAPFFSVGADNPFTTTLKNINLFNNIAGNSENAIVAIAEHNKLAFDTTFTADSGYIFYSGIPDETGVPAEHVFINLLDSVDFETSENLYTLGFVEPVVTTRDGVYLPLILVDDSSLPSKVIDRFALEQAHTTSKYNEHLLCNGFWELWANDEDGIIYARYVIDITYDAIYISGTGNDNNWGYLPTIPVRTFARAKQILEQQKERGKTIPYIYVVGNLPITDAQEWSLEGYDTIMKRYPGATGYNAYSGYMISVPAGGSLTLDDITISGYGKDTPQGGSIIDVSGGTVVMNDGAVLKENRAAHASGATSYGGGVSMTRGSFTMNSGSSIVDCNARVGGGFYLSNSNGVLTMNTGSSIENCMATYYSSTSYPGYGGAIYQNTGTVYLNSGVYLSGAQYSDEYSYGVGSVYYTSGGATYLSPNATLEKASETNTQSEIYLGSTSAALYINGTPTPEQLSSGKFGIDVDLRYFTMLSRVVQATSYNYSGLFTRGENIMSYPYAIARGNSNDLILVYEGVYVDGRRGNDANGGTSPYDAVKTYPVAEQRLLDAIAANPDFTQRIYISGTITVSGTESWGDVWAAAGNTEPIQTFRVTDYFNNNTVIYTAGGDLTLNNIALNGGRAGTGTTMYGSAPSYMIRAYGAGSSVTLNDTSITNATNAVNSNAGTAAAHSSVTMNGNSYISDIGGSGVILADYCDFTANDDSYITGTSLTANYYPVYLDGYSTFELNGNAAIRANGTSGTRTHTAVYLNGAETAFTMNDDSKIYGNYSNNYTICLAGANSTFTMTGNAKLYDNVAALNTVYVYGANASLVMSGQPEIYGNTASNGYTVDLYGLNASLNMDTAAKIYNNTASKLVTVNAVSDNASIDISGGIIAAMSPDDRAIDFDGGYFGLGGASAISGYVYLLGDGTVPITLTSDITSPDGMDVSEFRLSVSQNYMYQTVVDGTEEHDATGYHEDDNLVIFFTNFDGSDWIVLEKDNLRNDIVAAADSPHVHIGGRQDVNEDGYIGDDANSGRTPFMPVETWERAMEVLADCDAGANIVVVDKVEIKADETWSLPERTVDGVTYTPIVQRLMSYGGNTDYHMIEVQGGAELTLENITIDGLQEGFSAASGSAVYVLDGGELTVNDGSVIQNNRAVNGGGVYVEGAAVMNGGSIAGNSAIYGAGVYVANNGEFTLNGGAVSANEVNVSTNTTANVQYGGAGVYNAGTFTMAGGAVSANTVTYINSNTGNSQYGTAGGAGVYNTGEFNLTGGAISENIARAERYRSGNSYHGYAYTCGGGVLNNNGAVMTMRGGEISGNKAVGANAYRSCSYGGGVYNNGTLTVYDGLISENAATCEDTVQQDNYSYGGGIYNLRTLDLYGGEISGNTCSTDSDLATPYQKNLYGAGVCNTGSAAVMQMLEGTDGEGEPTACAITGNETVDTTHNVYAHMYLYGGGIYNSSARLTIEAGSVSGNTLSATHLGYSTYSVFVSGGGIYNYSGTVVVGEKGSVSGNTVTAIGYSASYIYAYARGAGVYTYSGSLTLNGGTVSGNDAAVDKANRAYCQGGGIYIDASTVNINEGSAVSGNSVTATNATSNYIYGGGIYHTGGAALNINGGVISNNEAQNYGGGVCSGSNGLNIYAGSIEGNRAPNTAGVYFSGTNITAKMYGGSITGNVASSNGGGLGVYNTAIFEMYGGEISGNTAAVNGGGVAVYGTSTFKSYGGEICDNEAAAGIGGGIDSIGNVVLGKTTYTLNNVSYTTDGPLIDGNSAGTNGGGVYQGATGAYTMTMTGGTIGANNTVGADGDGEAVYIVKNATMKLSGEAYILAEVYLQAIDDTQINSYGDQRDAFITVMGEITDGTDILEIPVDFDNQIEYRIVAKRSDTSVDQNRYFTPVAPWGDLGQHEIANKRFEDVCLWYLKDIRNPRIYVNGVSGSDTSGDGSYLTPYASFAAAKNKLIELRADGNEYNGYIYITGMVTVSSDETWSLDGLDAIVIRYDGSASGDMTQLWGYTGLEYEGNYATGDGTLVKVAAPATLTLENITFNGAFYDDMINDVDAYGPLVLVDEGAFLTVSDGAVLSRNGRVNGDGGGIYNLGTTTLAGGTVTTNFTTAGSGGGVYNAGELYLDRGSVTVNKASVDGGGVYMAAGDLLLTDGSTVSLNTAAANGGGIYVPATGELIMTGGTVNENTAKNGGGVFSLGTILLTEGEDGEGNETAATVSGNFASQVTSFNGNLSSFGGGIYNGGELVMRAGVISGNTVEIINAYRSSIYNRSYGGGIYNSGSLELYGGEVRSNLSWASSGTRTTTSWYGRYTYGYGGGIANIGVFTMHGGKVSENTAHGVYGASGRSGYGNGVYSADNFTMYGGEISDNKHISHPYTDHYGGGMYVAGTTNIYGGEIKGNTSYYGGGIYLSGTATVVNLYGGVIDNNTAAYAGGGVSIFNGALNLSSFTDGEGATTQPVISANKVSSNSNSVDYGGGGIHVYGGTMNMSAGEITRNTGSYFGGGIHVRAYNATTVNFTGGTVTNNSASYGAGILTYGGAININAGEDGGRLSVTGNTASNNGGGMNFYNATVANVHDVLVSGNTAARGGAVYIESTSVKVNIYGGDYIENTVTSRGGAVYNDSSGTGVIISGGNFSNNKAGSSGGGICNYNSARLTMTGGTVSGNSLTSTSGEGGGIFNGSSGTLSISDVEITGNTGGQNGGGICNNGTISAITDSTISGNKATGSGATGGGIYNTGTISAITGSTISGNKAVSTSATPQSYGGGVYTRSALTVTDSVIDGNEAVTGAGMYIHENSTATIAVTLNNTAVSNNLASGNGGGVFVNKTSSTGTVNLNLRGSDIIGNEALNGGGIYINNTTTNGRINITAADTDITANKATGATGKGGGVYTTNPLSLNRCNVSRNTAASDGGGIYSSGQLTVQNSVVNANVSSGSGGGIYTSGTRFDFGNISVYGNRALNGGGMYLNNATATYTLYNDEVFDNTAGNKGDAIYVKAGNLYIKGSKPLVNGSIFLYEKAYPITVSSLITNIRRNYTVEVNPSVTAGDGLYTYGDTVIRPDGIYVKDVTSYMSNFTLNNLSFVIGRDAPNLVLDACVFIDSVHGSDSNSGFTPELPLASFEAAKTLLGKNGGVVFVSGTVIVDDEQAWSFDYPRQYIQRYTGFTLGGGATYDAFLGDMVRVDEGGRLTLEGVSVSGRRDYDEVVSGITGSVFVVNGGELVVDGATSIQNNVTSGNGGAIRIQGGTAQLLSGAKLDNTEAANGSSVYNYSGSLTLTGEAKLSGGVYLDGAGTAQTSGVITVTEPLMTATVPAIDIGDAYAGRPVIVYPDGAEPGETEKAKWLLDGDVLSLYSLNNFSGDTDILELQEKGKIYINGVSGNDDYDGTTPRYAVRTLERAYELLVENGGVMIVVNTVTVDGAVELSDTAYTSGGTTVDISAGNNIVIRRYSQPQIAETNENYQVESNLNSLFNVTGTLTLSDGLLVDGHASAVTSGSETSIAEAVQAQSALISVSGGTLNVSDKVRLRSNNNVSESNFGGAISINGGTAAITGETDISETESKRGSAIYQNGTLIVNNSPYIDGEVWLGANKVITVSADALYNFTPKKNLEVNMGDPSDGRDVAVYNTNLVPAVNEIRLFKLPDDITGTYIVGNDPDARNIIQLNVKTAVYIDGVSGNDASSGDTPDEAVLTLERAFDLLRQRGGGTLFVVDTVEVPGMATISSDNVTVGGTTINFSAGSTFIIKRYARPDAHESLEGFTHSDNANTLFNVTGSLSLYGVTVDGHNDPIVQSNLEYDRSTGVKATSALITVSSEGSLNVREGCVLKNNTNLLNGGAINSAGIVAIRDSSVILNEAKNGGGIYTAGGTVTMFNGSVEENLAENGGGMYIGGEFTQNGGTIANNTAENGSGIYLDGSFNMNANAIVSETNDVFLAPGRFITVAQPLTAAGVAAVFTPDPYEMYRKVLDYSAIYEADDDIAADFNTHFRLTPNIYPYYVIQSGTDGVLYLDPFNVSYDLTDTTTTGADKVERYTDLVVPFEVGALYDYPADIAVTVTDELTGEAVVITAEQYEYDAETGVLTVPYEFITGDILIEATAYHKQYDVVTVLTKLDFTGAEKAEADTEYTATLTPDRPGYSLPDSITVTVGGVELEAGTDYTYDSTTGEIAITGSEVVGTVTITADAVANVYDVTAELTKLTYSGEATATCDVEYTAALTADIGYSLPENITVTVAAEAGDITLEKDNGYTYDSTTGEIVIDGEKIIGDITIAAAGVPNVYSVTTDLTKLTSDGEATATCDTDYTAVLTPDTGYSLPDNIVVTVGETELEAGTDYTYNNETGEIVIYGDKIIGDITIDADAVPNVYDVITELYKLTYNGEATATCGTNYEATLVPLNGGFNLPGEIEITIGDRTAVEGVDYTYDSETGAIVVSGDVIIGDITVKADAVPNTYTVTAQVTDITYTGESTATAGTDYTASLSAAAGISLPDDITVTIGELTATVGTEYTYDSADGSIVILGDSITGDIVITAAGIIRVNDVIPNVTNLTFMGEATVLTGNNYEAQLTANEHYSLPESIEVKVGYNTLTVDVDYTYDEQTGAIHIFGAAIVHDVTITADGVPDIYPVTTTLSNLTSDGEATVGYNTEYTATLTPGTGYNFPESITVKVLGVELTEGEGYTYDALTGEILIYAQSVTGAVEIMADGVPKVYDVTNELENLTSDGEETATYGTDYEATLTPGTGHDLPGDITVTVDGAELVEGTDYTYDNTTGEIVIDGDKILGDITIEADAVPKVYEVTTDLTNLTSDGEETAAYGTDYTATLTPDVGYDLPEDITVTVDGAELVEGTDYTYNSTTGEIVIDGDKIIGDVTIEATGDVIVIGVDNQLVNTDTSNTETEFNYGSEYSTVLEAHTGHTLPETITVLVGGAELTEGYTYNPATGELVIEGEYVTDDVTIIAVSEIMVFNITSVLENVTGTNTDNTIEYGEQYSTVLTADEGCDLPANVVVTVGGTQITEGYTYNSTTGELVIDGSAVTGDITVTAIGTLKVYGVTADVTNAAFAGGATASHGLTYTAVLTANEGCLLPDEITVTVNGVTLDAGAYTYDKASGAVEIPEGVINGAVVITAKAHKLITVTTAATCTEDGLTVVKCEDCEEVFSETVLPKLGHDLGEWYVYEAARCCYEGEERRDCSRCDHYESRTIPATGEHSFGEWYTETQPTCCNEGVERRDCQVGPYFETRPIEPTGEHELGDWFVHIAATCCHEGEERRVCETGEHYVSRPIPATGEHVFGEWYVTLEATCKEPGEQRRDCQVGPYFETKEIPATDEHTFSGGRCSHCGVGQYYHIVLNKPKNFRYKINGRIYGHYEILEVEYGTDLVIEIQMGTMYNKSNYYFTVNGEHYPKTEDNKYVIEHVDREMLVVVAGVTKNKTSSIIEYLKMFFIMLIEMITNETKYE